MYIQKKLIKYILLFLFIISAIKIYYLYKNCKVENLTLTEYTTVYSDSINKKIDKLILTSQSLVTSLNNDTNVLNTNVTNSTNSINSTSTKTTINNISVNKTLLTTKVTDIQNTINSQTASQTALTDLQKLNTKFNSNISISAFSYIPYSKIDPKLAMINTKLIPNQNDQNNLYTISYLSSSNLQTLISNLKT